jgi:hypothetical protein
MSLDDLASRADRVFRGSVVSAEPGTTEIGGGNLPTITYGGRRLQHATKMAP